MWIVAAVFSAIFAGVTAILSKCGMKDVNSDVATAIRTGVVFVFAWLIVLITGAYATLATIDPKSLVFLILSGLATGGSWICYFKALSLGEVSKVAAVDKSSVVFSVLIAILVFPEERTLWWVKLLCLAAVAVAWGIVFFRKETKSVKEIKGKELLFLVLSGFATGGSWLCYYYAIQQGQVSVVVPIDKLSIVLTVVFSVLFLKEKPSAKTWLGLALLATGSLCMAIFT